VTTRALSAWVVMSIAMLVGMANRPAGAMPANTPAGRGVGVAVGGEKIGRAGVTCAHTVVGWPDYWIYDSDGRA
jgi:hypothetical protein